MDRQTSNQHTRVLPTESPLISFGFDVLDASASPATQCADGQGEELDEPRSIRVLMVDDDAAYRTLCSRYLKRDKTREFVLEGADSGARALDMCTPGRFDCLLIDYRLPDATGTEVLSNLREALGDSMPPAIILTAMGGEAAATEAVRAGASDFLAKRDVSPESIRRILSNSAEKGRLRAQNLERRNALRQANEQLRSRNAEIQRFYHTVAHEVKTPLTAVREFIAIIQDDLAGPTTEQQREILGYALESCDQLTGHFNDLVTMTRIQNGKLTVEPRWCDLETVVTRCLTAARVAGKEKGIYIEDRMTRPLPLVWMDANPVSQVLANLLNNAVKFTDVGGEVELSCRLDDAAGTIEIRVRDSGPGIEAEHLSQVFDRLYQVSPNISGPNEGGLGLGLSIALEIMQRHGDELRVESEFGEGSTFSFRLNTFDGSAEQAEQAPPPASRSHSQK